MRPNQGTRGGFARERGHLTTVGGPFSFRTMITAHVWYFGYFGFGFRPGGSRPCLCV